MRVPRSAAQGTLSAIALFLVAVVCLLAPLYAARISHTDPFRSNVEGSTTRGGVSLPVLAQNTTGLGLGATPIGPAWSFAYPLGADSQGRDIAARLLYGGRTSLLIAAAATALSLVLAGCVGVLAGALGGPVDAVLRWLLDLLWAFPVFLLAISLSAVLATSGLHLGPITIDADDPVLTVAILGIVFVPYVARPVRAQVLALREADFVQAAVSLGGSWPHVVWRHLVPHAAATVLLFAPTVMAFDLLTEASLSVLGVGGSAAGRQLGHADRGRAGAALFPPGGGRCAGPGGRRDRVAAQPPGRRAAPGSVATMSLLGRLAQALAVLFGISVLVFLIFFATPGADPASRLAGRGASPETLAAVRAQFGLARPLPVQYARMMEGLFVTRDLTSFVNRGEAVVPAVLDAAPVTLLLAGGAAVLWLVGALVIGLLASASQAGGRVAIAAGLVGMSVPAFWLGEVVNLLTQRTLHGTWLFGWVPPLGLGVSFAGMVLPWTTLALLYAGIYGRVLHAGLAGALLSDPIRTARAKGVSELAVLLRHALRLSAVPVVALFGLDFGALLGGGTVLTEVVFGLHGVGKLTYDALQTLDLPMLMAVVMYGAVAVVAVNAIADGVLWRLDPRRDG